MNSKIQEPYKIAFRSENINLPHCTAKSQRGKKKEILLWDNIVTKKELDKLFLRFSKIQVLEFNIIRIFEARLLSFQINIKNTKLSLIWVPRLLTFSRSAERRQKVPTT